MTREVRKVPADWQHPTAGRYSDGQVRYVPLFDGSKFEAKAARWDEEAAQWARGEFPEDASESAKTMSYEDWEGPRPDPEHYMPRWADSERAHFMMYEVTSEGTPISPVCASLEELARWLTEHKETVYAGKTLTYEQWLGVCKGESFTFSM